MNMIEKKYENIARFAEKGIPIVEKIGVRVLAISERSVELMVPLEGNANHYGVMYAGVIFTLADIAGGALFGASLDYRQYFPTLKEINLKFRRPVLSDLFVSVSLTGETVQRVNDELASAGKADYVMEMELKNATGEVTDRATVTFQARPTPPGLKIFPD
jgi:thioesterase domain-containing protein